MKKNINKKNWLNFLAVIYWMVIFWHLFKHYEEYFWKLKEFSVRLVLQKVTFL